jgi:putative ubiquitin-RnfH superfamily antitoxin RatB of RatAB toxin-antitoxin module
MAETDNTLTVTVIFARPDEQSEIVVVVPKGATIRAAIERSRITDIYPEIDLAVNKVGTFGVLRDFSHTVQAGDRIEIYRPLLIDPKEARRRNAAIEKTSKGHRQ